MRSLNNRNVLWTRQLTLMVECPLQSLHVACQGLRSMYYLQGNGNPVDTVAPCGTHEQTRQLERMFLSCFEVEPCGRTYRTEGLNRPRSKGYIHSWIQDLYICWPSSVVLGETLTQIYRFRLRMQPLVRIQRIDIACITEQCLCAR